MRSFRQRKKKLSGFTLIELIVVMALISFMAMVAVPRLWGYYANLQQQKRLETFWSQVLDDAHKYNQLGESYWFNSQDEKWRELAQQQQIEILPNYPDDQFVIRPDGFIQHGVVRLLLLPQNARWQIEVSMPDGHVTMSRY